MAARETFNHNIKRRRQLRKINHPSMAEDWHEISKEDRANRFLVWKININLKKNGGEVR